MKLDKKPLMTYKKFEQWEKDCYFDYVNHSHVTEQECEIKPLKPYQLKEYYKAYLTWYCKYQAGKLFE